MPNRLNHCPSSSTGQYAAPGPVDKVVVELLHAHLVVLQNGESHLNGQTIRDGFLTHLDLVYIVDVDVELTEPSVVDLGRRQNLRAVLHVTMSVHVGYGLSEFHRSLVVSAMIALCGWTLPSRRAVDTASPNRPKHRIEVFSMT